MPGQIVEELLEGGGEPFHADQPGGVQGGAMPAFERLLDGDEQGEFPGSRSSDAVVSRRRSP